MIFFKGVKLVVVTKSFDIFQVRKFKEKGFSCFGENRVNDAELKINQISGEWHLIGHLQTNKVRKAIRIFDFIQSVDSISIAKKIDLECKKIKKIIPVLIQINITKESQKFGFKKEEISFALEEISKLKNLNLMGFMAMGKSKDESNNRFYFREMKKIFEKYKQKYSLVWLSMGMSDDYKTAIEEGANMIRIGRKAVEIL